MGTKACEFESEFDIILVNLQKYSKEVEEGDLERMDGCGVEWGGVGGRG